MSTHVKKRGKRSKPLWMYTIKITLNRVRPPIWRRIVVRSDATLGDLHATLQQAMGWSGGHLHMLNVNGVEYSGPSVFGGEDLDELDCEHEDSALVGDVLSLGGKFTYEYDFGDGWEHTGVVEKVEPALPSARAAACIAGKRCCPPEDCGGPWGYGRLLELLANPAMPDPDGVREWLVSGFDPEEFDAKAVDKKLARMCE